MCSDVTYHFRESRKRREQRRWRVALSVYRVEQQHEPRPRVLPGLAQHLSQGDGELRQRLAAPRREVLRLHRRGDRGYDALKQVPRRDALRRVDAGIAKSRRLCLVCGLVAARLAQPVEERLCDARLSGGLGAVDDEVSAGNRIGL